MEKAMYPCKVIRITQKDHEGTHSACWAVDEAGIDGGISNFIMPFDGTVKKIYTADANEVWIESNDVLEYPDGTQDYMTLMFAHDNDVSDLWVGKQIPAGTIFYQEGTKGKAYGNHVHFECGKGKFTGSGWYQDTSGAWSIINGKKVTDCLWIDDNYDVKDTRGYTFKKVVTHFGTPVNRDEYKDQVQIKEGMASVRARNGANGDILGYMNVGLYNVLETSYDDVYTWCKVEDGLWFAYSPEWAEYYEGKEIPIMSEENEAEKLQKEIEKLEAKILLLEKQIENMPEEIFICKKTGKYQIQLYQGERLYIK